MPPPVRLARIGAFTSPAAAQPRRRGFAGLPENVVVVSHPESEETPRFVAGDVGAIGCVQADARLDRVRLSSACRTAAVSRAASA